MEVEMEETYPTPAERKRLGTVVGGGASVEVLAGLAAVTLAILGLAGVLSFHTLTIAMIVAGAALFVDGILVGGAYREVQHAHRVREGRDDVVPIRTGLSAQALGGAIAVVLGILALAGFFSATWTAIAVVVLGTALLVGTLTHGELDWSAFELHHSASPRPAFRRTVRIAAFGAAGVMFLGVLSLAAIAGPTGRMPFRLILVALLCVGIVELMDGAMVLGRIATKPAVPDVRNHRARGFP
jgi:hypothetical protein